MIRFGLSGGERVMRELGNMIFCSSSLFVAECSVHFIGRDLA